MCKLKLRTTREFLENVTNDKYNFCNDNKIGNLSTELSNRFINISDHGKLDISIHLNLFFISATLNLHIIAYFRISFKGVKPSKIKLIRMSPDVLFVLSYSGKWEKNSSKKVKSDMISSHLSMQLQFKAMIGRMFYKKISG